MTHVWTQQAAIGFVAPPAPLHYHATELEAARASFGRRPTTKPYGKNRQQVLGGGIGVALRCNRNNGSSIDSNNSSSSSSVPQQPALTATPSDTGNKTGPPTADSCIISSFSVYSTTAPSRADFLWKATGALLVVATGTTGMGASARSASAVGDGGAIDSLDDEQKTLHVRAVLKFSSASPCCYLRNTPCTSVCSTTLGAVVNSQNTRQTLRALLSDVLQC